MDLNGMNKTTYFTVDPNISDHCFLMGKPVNPVNRLCFERAQEVFGKVEVITNEDAIAKEALLGDMAFVENCYAKNCSMSYVSDMIRLYVMTKYKNMFYFDWDVYINEVVRPYPEHFATNDMSFALMSNGSDLDMPALLYKKCIQMNHPVDREILSVTNAHTNARFIWQNHLNYFGRYNRLHGLVNSEKGIKVLQAKAIEFNCRKGFKPYLLTKSKVSVAKGVSDISHLPPVFVKTLVDDMKKNCLFIDLRENESGMIDTNIIYNKDKIR